MIHGKLVFQNDLENIIDVRRKVIKEETGEIIENLKESRDHSGFHAIILENINSDSIVATGRGYYDGNNYIIDYVAVLTRYRKKGYGDFILRMLINKGINLNASKIIINAQTKYIQFYEKYGFIKVNNLTNITNGIEHTNLVLLEKELKKPCENRK